MRLELIFHLFLMLLFSGAALAAETDPLPAGMALRGDFEHKRRLEGFDNPLVSKGFFVLVPKITLLWQTNEPVKSRIVIADGFVRQILDGKEVFAKSIFGSGRLERFVRSFASRP